MQKVKELICCWTGSSYGAEFIQDDGKTWLRRRLSHMTKSMVKTYERMSNISRAGQGDHLSSLIVVVNGVFIEDIKVVESCLC